MPTTAAKDLGIATGEWTADASHSTVEFVVRHMMVSKVRGHFQKFEVKTDIAEDVTQSTVTAKIYADSITTRDEARDGHLRSADFFDTAKFDLITFNSTSIRPDGDSWVLSGDLTIRGVTKPIDLALEFNGTSPDPYGGLRSGFSARGQLSRAAFGLEWNAALETGGVIVGDTVTIALEMELVKA